MNLKTLIISICLLLPTSTYAEADISMLSNHEKMCTVKVGITIGTAFLRAHGHPIELALERAKETWKRQTNQYDIEYTYASVVDYHRIIRDIYRTDSNGDYKIPIGSIDEAALPQLEFNKCADNHF